MTLTKWFDDETMEAEAWAILRTRLVHMVAINLPNKELMQWKVKEKFFKNHEESTLEWTQLWLCLKIIGSWHVRYVRVDRTFVE